jgi:hypothetical protein
MMTDEELTVIYKTANNEVGKGQPITTQRIFTAMRAVEKAAYERAERACLAIRSDSSDGYYDAIADCVYEIRALKGKKE